MNQQSRTLLLSGFTDDLANVQKLLGTTLAPTTQVTEDANDADIPDAADIVIYVFSTDTGYSSQLHSIFTRIHDRVLSRREYLMMIEGSDLLRAAFPEISHLPKISIDDLKEKLERPKE